MEGLFWQSFGATVRFSRSDAQDPCYYLQGVTHIGEKITPFRAIFIIDYKKVHLWGDKFRKDVFPQTVAFPARACFLAAESNPNFWPHHPLGQVYCSRQNSYMWWASDEHPWTHQLIPRWGQVLQTPFGWETTQETAVGGVSTSLPAWAVSSVTTELPEPQISSLRGERQALWSQQYRLTN